MSRPDAKEPNIILTKDLGRYGGQIIAGALGGKLSRNGDLYTEITLPYGDVRIQLDRKPTVQDPYRCVLYSGAKEYPLDQTAVILEKRRARFVSIATVDGMMSEDARLIFRVITLMPQGVTITEIGELDSEVCLALGMLSSGTSGEAPE